MRNSRLRERFLANTILASLAIGTVGAAFVAVPVSAQDYTNVTAGGQVKDASGKGIPQAAVSFKSNEQGFTRNVVTDNSGNYRAPQISPGSYTVTVTASGYDTFTDNNVMLGQSSAGNDFELAKAGSAATTADTGAIVVTGRRIKVADFERTTTGAVINVGDLAARVPVQRSLRDVILLAPGTTQGGSAQNSAFANQAGISGSSFTENAYYVNGLNITEFRQGFSPVAIPFDFYDTVEVKTGGFPAEFGRATGGVVNATTKSGSNEFHASVLFNFEPNALTEKSPDTYLDDNDHDYRQRTDTVFQASGPIIKDHLFFYGIYNFRNITTGDGLTTGGTYATQHTTSPFYGGKIDAIPLDGQHLEFTYFNTTGVSSYLTQDYNSATNKVGNVLGNTLIRSGGANYVGRYTGQLAKWITISAAYGVNKNRSGNIPSDTATPQVLDFRTDPSGPLLPGSNPAVEFVTNNDKRQFYRGDVDLYFSLLGSHHIRVGYDHEKLTSVQNDQYTGGRLEELFTSTGTDVSGLPAGTDYIQARTFLNGGSFNTINKAAYIEDSWSLFQNRLTLQLGIRDDKFTNKGGDGHAFYTSPNQWGPRIGFTLDPFGDGKTKVFGSFGRYFVPIASNTNIRSAGVETDYQKYNLLAGFDANGQPVAGAPILGTVNNERACPDGTGNNCVVTRDGTAQDPSTLISQSLQPQSLDEYILGAERRIGNRMKISINFTHRSLDKVLEDAAIDQAALRYCEQQGFAAADCAKIYGGFSQYVLINPGYGAKIKLNGLPDGTQPVVTFSAADLGYPKAKRTYNAATLQYDREFDGIWSLSASYTWSKLKGNYEGGADSDIGQADTGATEAFDQPGFTVGSYGLLPADRRHTIKVYGSYQPFDWLSVGANVLVQSPRHFGCIGIVPTSVDPFAAQYEGGGFFCQGVEVPRGSAFTSDWKKQLDMSFAFKVPGKLGATLTFQVYNVFNTKAKLDFDEIGDLSSGAPDTNYKKVITYEQPRQATATLRIGF